MADQVPALPLGVLTGEAQAFALVGDADAHQQLGGPIVLVWDNSNTHVTAGMRRYIAERDWLTVYRLPPYAQCC